MAKETKRPADQAAMQSYDWSQSGITGFEHTQDTDLGIPFLAILQDGSPQIKKSDPNYALKKIEGAGPGDIVNSIANVVVHKQGGAPIQFVPCTHERLYVEWKPRESGGGMVKVHKNAAITLECVRDERGRDVLKGGNIIMTTSYFYGLLLDEAGERKPVVIGMTSTQLKKARQWLNMMTALKMTSASGQKFTPPMFSHIYALSTVAEANAEGSWFGWQIRMSGPLTDQELIKKALETAKSSFTGRAVLPPPSSETESHM